MQKSTLREPDIVTSTGPPTPACAEHERSSRRSAERLSSSRRWRLTIA